MNSRIENLNLITTYPVRWDMYKILRDFIQNFYDSVPNEEFNKRFIYEYKNEVLEIRCSDVSYSYEWLLHIGASSKTNSEDKAYAGYFGEGFKVASLCAMRDYNLKVETSSDNWHIEVIEEAIIIDGIQKKSLAYKIETLDKSAKDTILILRNFKKEYFEKFHCALYSFYYEENLLLGEKIFDDKVCSIHYRSEVKKFRGYPSSYDSSGDGIVFAAYQARGSLKHPLVFCYHEHIDNDREREFFSNIDNIDIMIKCIRRITPEVAMKLLILLKKLWYVYPKERFGYNSYYTVIKNLVLKIESEPKEAQKFTKLYPKLLYARKIPTSDKRALNTRKYSLEWHRNNKDYTLVQDTFRYLGIQSLEDRCSEEDILPKINFPTLKEEIYINILKDCVKELFEGFLDLEKSPECKVIKNLKASVSGYASITENKEKNKNLHGYKYKYNLNLICIKERYLKENQFSGALTVFIHELCHTFGGDKSENFSYALTDMLEIVLEKITVVEKYKRIWENIK